MVTEKLLDTRYPDLKFLLQFGDNSSLPFSLHTENLEEETKNLFCRLNLNKLQLIYIYGLGLGFYYFPLKKWLEEKRDRDLVFIEENISTLRSFLKMNHAAEILGHPQIHIRFNTDKKRLDQFLEECAQDFPVENMDMISLFSYKKYYRSRFYRMRLTIRIITKNEN